MSSDLIDSSDGLMCNACQITITSAEQRTEHYKSEWHRYNVKRRCAGLASITQQLFASQLAALNRQQQEQTRQSASQKCTTCNKTFSSESSYEAHLITKTHLKRAAKGEEELNMKKSSKQQKTRLHQPVVATSLPSQKEDTTVTSTPTTISTIPAPATLSTSTDTKQDGDVDMDGVDGVDDDDDIEDIDGIQTPAIPASHCLFCNRHISTFTDLLDHMLKQHGFFIPFIEHCTDLSSFIDYLGVKVGVGRVCLYCNGRGRARYPSVRSVQQHMMAKHHCKLRFEDDEEYEEYCEFFTFPDDDVEDEVESEDIPMSSRDRLEMLKNSSTTTSTSTSTSTSTKRHLTGMNDAGELVLSDGSTIGHRSLVNIYKQNFRPREVRESVKINQLMAEYRALEMPGYLVNKTRSDNVPIKVQRRINRVREKTNLAANFQHHFRPQVDF